MPSGHTTLATAITIGIALLLTTGWSPKKRKLIYVPALILAFCIGISRLYLGAHWFTDVLAGWLLGSAIVMLIVLSFNRQTEKKIPVFSTLLVGFLALSVTYSYFYHTHFATLKKNHTQIDWPKKIISLSDWWQHPYTITSLRASLFGFPSQKINIQWQGNIDAIEKTLLAAGWETPPARDWISTIHRIADVKSAEYLPLVSPQFLDKKPALILAKSINGDKKLIVIRLWESNFIFKENNQPLWVGTIGPVPRSYSWIFRKHRDIDLNEVMKLPSVDKHKWQWKLITVKPQLKRRRQNQDYIILLIKERK